MVKSKNKNKNKNKNKSKNKSKNKNYNIINFIQYLIKNYKTNVLFIVIFYYLCSDNLFIGFITSIYYIFMFYIFHIFAHIKSLSFISYLHLQHHSNNSLFGYINEIAFEIMYFLVTPLLLQKFFLFDSLNNFIILFFFIIIQSIHIINYSVFHVNNIHEKHHISYDKTPNRVKNFGPDAADILFGTKYKPDTNIENVDHLIPNILVAFCVVYYLQYCWKKTQNKILMMLFYKIFILIAIIFYLLLFIII